MSLVEFLKQTIAGKINVDQQLEFLNNKSDYDAEELADVVVYLQSQMTATPELHEAIDVCGTGGSGLDRINTSTISTFLLASMGVGIAKHGNNAASGRFGSFDLLDALEIPTQLSPEELQARFKAYNLAFLYAKQFHPMMRFFGPVRAQLNKPTFFNILGPLLSPVNADRQIIGTSNKDYMLLIAETCQKLGKKRVLVVRGCDGLDEVTLSGETDIVELKDGKISSYQITPEDFGIERVADFSELSGGSAETNLRHAKDILSGTELSRRSDLVLVNTALALVLVDKYQDLKSAYQASKKFLSSGQVIELINKYSQPTIIKIIAQKRLKTLQAPKEKIANQKHNFKGGLIAEIKHSSPSAGKLFDGDILAQARSYEQNGAKAISVVTEPEYFDGNLNEIAQIRAVVNVPILCKDFVTTIKQIDFISVSGADMILIIAAILNTNSVQELVEHALRVGLEPVVEVHNQTELQQALSTKTRIIGINSRNLHDFSIDPNLFDKLADQIPAEILAIAESGIEKFSDINTKAQGWLVGGSIIKAQCPEFKIRELSGQPLIKLCGLRELAAAELCEELGVDMIGLNFVDRSHRKIDLETAHQIRKLCKTTKVVGVFENHSLDEVNHVTEELDLDFIQLAGDEEYAEKCIRPVIKTRAVDQSENRSVFMEIIDSKIPGSGASFDHSKLEFRTNALIAGGISSDNVEKLLLEKQPLGIDTAGGIETNSENDLDKIKELVAIIRKVNYAKS